MRGGAWEREQRQAAGGEDCARMKERRRDERDQAVKEARCSASTVDLEARSGCGEEQHLQRAP